MNIKGGKTSHLDRISCEIFSSSFNHNFSTLLSLTLVKRIFIQMKDNFNLIVNFFIFFYIFYYSKLNMCGIENYYSCYTCYSYFFTHVMFTVISILEVKSYFYHIFIGTSFSSCESSYWHFALTFITQGWISKQNYKCIFSFLLVSWRVFLSSQTIILFFYFISWKGNW